MIRVVIIDDDIEMLTGLKQIINWEQYGFTVIGEADNGEKGLELIRNHKPEVVLTDITMPGMDGLALIEKAEKLIPDIKVIILTCHEDFGYAKQAIKLKAYDYVLKYTLTEEILVDVVSGLRNKIQQEAIINEKIFKIDEELKSNNDIFKQKVLKDLIHCNGRNQDVIKICKEAEAFHIKLPSKSYKLIGIFIDNYDINMENAGISSQLLFDLLEKEFNALFMETVDYCYFDHSLDTKCVLVWSDNYLKENNCCSIPLHSRLLSYHKRIRECSNLNLSITISNVKNDISKIDEAFRECEEMRREYFYNESLTVVKSEKEKWTNYSNLYGKYKDEWVEVLLIGNREKIMNFIGKLSAEVKNENYSPHIVKLLFNNLIIDIKSMSNKNGIEISGKMGFDTMNACCKSLENAIAAYCDGLQVALCGSLRNDIKKVLQYIDENLNDHISCDKMSEYIKMNTNYYSRLFKKETGSSFSDYVIKKKIEKATYFLKYSGLTVEEIAYLTGFSNVSYFYKTYKKSTGKTPGDVRTC